MTWANKAKIDDGGNNLKILTPDGFDILVGSSEDQVLIYQTAYTNWANKSRTAAGSYTLKSKITP